MRRIVVMALIITICLCIPVYAQEEVDTLPIEIRHPSIVQLIVFPFRYDAARIRVVGHVRAHGDTFAVYLSQSDAENEITKNGLWLELTATHQKQVSTLDRTVCVIEGTFNSRTNGPGGLWSGALEKITRLEAFEK